jgi:mannosyltransferase
MRAVVWFAAGYALALMLLAPHLSFWLDEVLTLTGAAQPDLASLMENLRKQQGATPLAFLIPHWTIGVTGLSPLTARLPSILASAASMPAMFLLARQAGLAFPGLAIAVFALWPLQFRYALEARPYAMALCLGMWLTVAFLRRWHWAIYTLLAVAMGLTHPYSLVIAASHLVWSGLYDRSRAMLPAGALLAAGAVLAPWYAHFSAGWRSRARQQLARWNPRAALVFVREISGSGYVGAALLLAGMVLGARSFLEQRRFWVVAVVLPLLAIPTANVAFDYFFAIRQLVYVVPALVLLFCAAPRWVVAAFLVVSLYSDMVWYRRPREDWAAASSAIAEERCVQFVGDSHKLFVFFRPELAGRSCAAVRRASYW